jgi:hypothetical protein
MKTLICSVSSLCAAAVLSIASGAYAQDKPCMADAARLCPNVEPGEGQMACLKEHKDDLSPGCKKKVMQMKIKQEEKKQLDEQQKGAPAPTP